MTAAGVTFPDAAYKSLWAKINTAIEEDKPQTAVGYLGELEQLVESKQDTLELYEVRRVTLEQLRKYNWKDANQYQPKFDDLHRQIMGDLDHYIEAGAFHKRVDNLIYEKVLRIKNAEDVKEQRSAEQYQKIREMCTLAVKEFPESSRLKDFQALIDMMDSKDLSFYTSGRVVYPGQDVEFKVESRNVIAADLMIFSLSDRYTLLDAEEAVEQLKKDDISRKVEDRTIRDYAGLYNINEETSFSHKFDKPGIYMVMLRSKDQMCVETLYVSSVAMSVREQGGKHQIYVADAMTGKPAREATVFAYTTDSDRQKGQSALAGPQYISEKKYDMDGFTNLTQSLFRLNERYSNIFAAVKTDRFCAPVSIWKSGWSMPEVRRSYVQNYLFTDRKMYRPDDTIQFKLISLSTNGEKGKVLGGRKVSVSLYAPGESKAAATVEVVTNDMGSAAGSFYIPAGNRNGQYRIEGGSASAWVRVEEYRDPGFRITLPEVEEMIVFGRPVVQKGVAKGYAGNPVSDARVEYTVERYSNWYRGYSEENRKVAEGTLNTDSSGRFEISFVPEAPAASDISEVYYQIDVKVTDMGGETFSQSRSVTVARRPLVFDIKFDGVKEEEDYYDAEKKITLVNKDKAKTFAVSVNNTDRHLLPVEGRWRLLKDGELKESGSFTSGEAVFENFKKLRSGTYDLECIVETAENGEVRDTSKVAFFSPNDKKSPVSGRLFFYPVNDRDAIDFMVGTTDELYLLVEVVDDGKTVWSRQLNLKNSAERIELPYRKEYKDKVMVSVYGIKDMKEIDSRHVFERTVPSFNFDVKINSLRDRTTPNTEETFTLEAPSSEALVTIYDVTTDRYGSNGFWFHPINEYYPDMPAIRSNLENRGRYYGMEMTKGAVVDDVMVVGYGAPKRMLMSARAANSAEKMDYAVAEAEESAGLGMPEPEPEEEVDARSDFAQTLAFIPKLEIEEGRPAEVKFTTRDGLSTFKVLVLAHTKDLRSGTATGEFTVSKAVMVQPAFPLFAVAGDRIVLKAPVSNMTAEAIKGTASIQFTDEASGRDYTLGCDDVEMNIPAGSQEAASWEIEIPGDIKNLGVTVTFKSKYGSDAEKHQIEIYPDSRYVTEAESFILGTGVDKDALIREMQKKYGRSDAHIRYEEYSTLDAVREVLKKPSAPERNNMIAWLDCLYVNQMRGMTAGADSVDVALSQKAAKRLEVMQKSDGGWGWFPCCSSSDELTMLFLDRMYYLRELGKMPRNTSLNQQIEKALGYVDKRIFEISAKKDYDWRSLIYFFAARMEHPNFAMSKDIQNILLDFLKKSKEQGWKDISIMEKAKLCTIYWATGEAKSQLKLMASLRDYAVRNKTVGCYFPNAVMPFRGLLHTEIYAHSVLAQMFAEMEQNDIAQGIFQWLLLQKHNQEWQSNMASADAVYVLLKYGAKDLKFGAVYYTYYSPLLKVQPSANEISVKRTYFRDGKELKNGDRLYVGDRIQARYDVCSTENRSFVEMKADRPACFYPVDERSYGFWNLYCSKEAGATTYYFQVLPEEDTRYTEEFFVTQEGTFNTGLVEIESKYAPEYRGHTGAFELQTEIK